ncbi:MAG: hypothetical protein Q7Q73_07380 [Verrucomicrobiota bacterium JB024]|nr:hypothetical protein [Verrucomicrobiota bacterium JB024]
MKTATSEKRSPRTTSKRLPAKDRKPAVAKPNIVPLSQVQDGPVKFWTLDGKECVHFREHFIFGQEKPRRSFGWDDDIEFLIESTSREYPFNGKPTYFSDYLVVPAEFVEVESGIDKYSMSEVLSCFSGQAEKGFFFRDHDDEPWVPGELTGIQCEATGFPYQSGSRFYAQCACAYCNVNLRQQIGN